MWILEDVLLKEINIHIEIDVDWNNKQKSILYIAWKKFIFTKIYKKNRLGSCWQLLITWWIEPLLFWRYTDNINLEILKYINNNININYK